MSFLVDFWWEKNKKAHWRAASMYLLKIAPDSFLCHVAPSYFIYIPSHRYMHHTYDGYSTTLCY